MLYLALSIALCAVAFLRGNFLLGLEFGIAYVFVAIVLASFVSSTLFPNGRRSFVQVTVAIALSLAVGLLMAFPAWMSPDLQHFIDKEAVDRNARTELGAVFAADSAYRDLSVSSVHLKAVNLTVRGLLGTRADLDRLRGRINRECPAVTQCVLHWDVTVGKPAARINGLDSELFGDGAAERQ